MKAGTDSDSCAHLRLTQEDDWQPRTGTYARRPLRARKPPWYDRVRALIEGYRGGTCLEVGACPGEVLLFLGKQHSLHCTALDFLPEVSGLSEAFAAHGVQARCIHADFFDWRPGGQFDIVYSCGFIEHFTDYEYAARRHWELVRAGGILLLSVPVLTPVQWLVRRVAYDRSRWRRMNETHNRRAMRLSALRRACTRCPGGALLQAGYTHHMRIWFGPSAPGIRPAARPLFRILRTFERIAERRDASSRLFSPEAFVVMRKQKDASP
jgi:2-polyprenyl-3-methyl-5-hydroxy-6-metoxy-1,4-benzoquinol methylase